MSSIITKNRTKTNKLLVVGHETSNLHLIVDVMKKHGLKHANNLLKEKILPGEISKIILKAHGLSEDTYTFDQMVVSSVWNGLAMDLMMSNIDHQKWMWADSSALPLLSYWKSLDNQLGFVLVYSSPEKYLENFFISSSKVTLEEINAGLVNWYDYHRSLLNYFYSNQDRAILVNTQQVQTNSIKYLEEIKKQIDLKDEDLLASEQDAINVNDVSEEHSVYNYFASQIIDTDEKVKALYLEMESIANLPFTSTEDQEETLLYDAISIYMSEKEQSNDFIKKIKLQGQSIKELELKSNSAVKTQKLEDENKLLLEQLFIVQEELEKVYLQKKELEKNTKKVKKKLYYGAADRIKQQLSYKLGAKIVELGRVWYGGFLVPFAMYSITKQHKREKNTKEKLPPIHTYVDAYEAEKIKRYLPYKFGQTIVVTKKSIFWPIKLPFALLSTYKKHRKERKNVPQ